MTERHHFGPHGVDAGQVQSEPTDSKATFRDLAMQVSNAAGSPIAFCAAASAVAVWAACGPLFDYSEGWQLTVNTGTTIVTFLMVFLIQAAQNRDTRLLQLKLDELIRAVNGARTELIVADELPDELIEQAEQEMRIAARSEGER